MARYAIGDVQGCYRTLRRLLRRARVDPARDRIWLVGDLVNRGPRSLAVLRWARSLGERAAIVLGNHELRLLALAEGLAQPDARDTLQEVLAAPDRAPLLDWLRRLPFAHREGSFLMVHAGLFPAWSAAQAEAAAAETAALLRGPQPRALLSALYPGPPGEVVWRPGAPLLERAAAAASALTSLRLCAPDGSLRRGLSGPPETAPADAIPWFDHPARRSRDLTVVCGHWAALGLRQRPDLLALDTGCVWGRVLTAVRLEDGALFQEPNADGAAAPGGSAATAGR